MAKKMRKKPRKNPGLLGHVTAPRYYDPPGPAPRETLAYLSPFEKRALLGMTDGRASRGPRGLPSFADDSASSMGRSRGDAYGTKGSGSDPGPNGGSVSRSSGGASPSNAGGGGSPSGMSGGALNSRLGGSLAANFGMSFDPGSAGYGSKLPGSFGYPASGPSQFSKDNAAQMAAMKAEREALQRMVGFTNAGAFPSVPLGGFPAAPSAFNPSRGTTVPSGPPASSLPGLSGPNMGLGENPAQPGNYTDPKIRISGIYSGFGVMPGSAFSNTDYTGLNVNPTLGAMNLPANLPSTGPVVQVGPEGLVFNAGRLAMDMPGQGMLDVPVSNKAAQVVAAAPTREAAINGLIGLGMARDTAEQYVGPTKQFTDRVPAEGASAFSPQDPTYIDPHIFSAFQKTKKTAPNTSPVQAAALNSVPPERLAIDMPGLGPLDVPVKDSFQQKLAALGPEAANAMIAKYMGPGQTFGNTPSQGSTTDYGPALLDDSLKPIVDAWTRAKEEIAPTLNRNLKAAMRRGRFGGDGGRGQIRDREIPPTEPVEAPAMPSTEELNSIYLALQAAGATPDELAAVLSMMNR